MNFHVVFFSLWVFFRVANHGVRARSGLSQTSFGARVRPDTKVLRLGVGSFVAVPKVSKFTFGFIYIDIMVNWKLVFWNLMGVMKMCFQGSAGGKANVWLAKSPSRPRGEALGYLSFLNLDGPYLVGGQLKYFLMFSPTWGDDPIWRAYFSNELKTATSYELMECTTVRFFHVFFGVVFHMGHVLHIAHVSALFYMTFWVSIVEAEGCNREAKRGRRSQMSRTLSWTLHRMAFSDIAYVIL